MYTHLYTCPNIHICTSVYVHCSVLSRSSSSVQRYLFNTECTRSLTAHDWRDIIRASLKLHFNLLNVYPSDVHFSLPNVPHSMITRYTLLNLHYRLYILECISLNVHHALYITRYESLVVHYSKYNVHYSVYVTVTVNVLFTWLTRYITFEHKEIENEDGCWKPNQVNRHHNCKWEIYAIKSSRLRKDVWISSSIY